MPTWNARTDGWTIPAQNSSLLQQVQLLQSAPGRGAHCYVRRVVEKWKPEEYKEIVKNSQGTQSFFASAESFFWAGIHAATEARQDPAALECIEFLDAASTECWHDRRYHTHLVRNAPLRCNGSLKETLGHPLLRIADVKYRNSPLEGKIICGLLEDLCLKQGITSEREGVERDLHLGQWVREGIRFGEWLLETNRKLLNKCSRHRVAAPGLHW